MLHKVHFIGLALILLGLGALAVCGCHHGMMRHCFHASAEKKAGWIVKKISKELDLTDDQKAKLEQIKTDVLAEHQKLKTPHQEMLDGFLSEMVKDSIDQKKLGRMMDEMHQRMETMKPFMISKLAEFHAMLTPEQRVKLVEKIREFHPQEGK